MSPFSAQQPIFILGMLQRTGTNHLSDLFELHPDVTTLEPVFEDHLLRWSSHLAAYVDDVERCWSSEWNVPEHEAPALLASLGQGVARWIAAHDDRRVVTKMPSVEQASRYFDLFAGCPLIILVRDGRNVSASGVLSFGWSYERAFRRWAAAADIVIEMQAAHGHRDDFAVVRYEDVIDRPGETMARLCELVGLDPLTYPFDAIETLPVRGSSGLVSASGEGEVHWTPVERSQDFDPHTRYDEWDDHTHRRFNAVAGAQQRRLGYELGNVDGSNDLSDRLRDARDLADVRARELRDKLGRSLRAVSRVHGRI